MNTTASEEPHTAEQERSQQIGRTEALPDGPAPGDGDTGRSDGPPERPVDHDRRGRGRPERPPLWWVLTLVATVLMLFAGVIGLAAAQMRRKEEP